MTRHEGIYHGLVTDGRTIFLRRSADARELFRQGPVAVWRAPRRGPDAKHVWAPELHRLDGRWWILYAADDGRNRHHRIWVLTAAGDDPAGPYRSAGMVQTGGWSIDATVLHDGGRNFLLWSGWEGEEKGPQNLYIAPLADGLTLAGPRALLARPTKPWEQRGGEICEGPAVVRRGGVTCVVYAASASWTVHACLGMLVNRDGNFLDPAAWIKTGPVFARTPQVWGVGHCSLVSDDEDGGLIFLPRQDAASAWLARPEHPRARFRVGRRGFAVFRRAGAGARCNLRGGGTRIKFLMETPSETPPSLVPRSGIIVLFLVLLVGAGVYFMKHRAHAGPPPGDAQTAANGNAPRHLAPHDTFYLLDYVSAKTGSGVIGFEPGQQVKLVEVHRDTRTLVVGDGKAQVEVGPEKLTNDMDVAALVRQKDQANQMAIAAYVQREQKAYDDAQRAAAVDTQKDIEKINQKEREASTTSGGDSKLNQPPVEVAGSGGGYGYAGNAYYGSPYSYLSGPVATTAAPTTNAAATGTGRR